MFPDDRHTNAQAQAGAAAGPLGSVKGIEDSRHGFGTNADAIILYGDGNAAGAQGHADVDMTGIANFTDGLFGVGNEIQQNLDQLVAVPHDRGQAGLRLKMDFDLIAPQGMFLQLEGALNEHIDVQRFFLRRSRAGKFQQILDNSRGAAGLPMSQFQLALHSFVGAGAFAKQFGDAKDGGEGIIQFVGYAREHLTHGGEFFRLDQLFFETLKIGNVAAGNNDAIDLVHFIEERAEMKTQAPPLTFFVTHAGFDGGKCFAAGENFVIHGAQGTAIFSLMRNIGGSIGISVVVALLSENTQIVHSRLVEHLRPDNPLAQAPFLASKFSLTDPSGIAALNVEVTRQAAMVAYIDDFKLMMVIVMLAAPLLLLLRKPRPARASGLAAAE